MNSKKITFLFTSIESTSGKKEGENWSKAEEAFSRGLA
jgi:hypothetical protein